MTYSELKHHTMTQNIEALRKVVVTSANISVAHAYTSEIIRSFNWETMSRDDALAGVEIVKEAIEIFHKIKLWQPERKKHD